MNITVAILDTSFCVLHNLYFLDIDQKICSSSELNDVSSEEDV